MTGSNVIVVFITRAGCHVGGGVRAISVVKADCGVPRCTPASVHVLHAISRVYTDLRNQRRRKTISTIRILCGLRAFETTAKSQEITAWTLALSCSNFQIFKMKFSNRPTAITRLDCVPYDNLKTITDIPLSVGSYVDWRKSRSSLHVKIRTAGQGHFSESSRSLGKVMSCSIAGSEIPSLMTSFFSRIFVVCRNASQWRIQGGGDGVIAPSPSPECEFCR